VCKGCGGWSAVAFSTDLGLRSEVGRRFGEGHSSELSSNGTKSCRDSPGPDVEVRARCDVPDGRLLAVETRAVASSAQIGRDFEYH
jgi:hypothetical protein